MPEENARVGQTQNGLLRWADPDVVLKLLEQSLPEGILCTYASARECPIYYISDMLLSRLGYSREEFLCLYGDDFHKAVYAEDAPETALAVGRVVETRKDAVLKFRLRRKDGALLWFRDTLRLVSLADGREMLVGVLFDITDIMERQNQQESRARELVKKNDQIARERDERARAAEIDGMTGLLNREATMRRIDEFLHGEGARGTHALLIVDVDDFKNVNDTFGHQVGDSVLIDVAVAIRGCFRDTDIVGRVGGDEFFVLMKNVAQKDSVRRKAGELVEALHLACAAQETCVDLSGSVGASMSEGGGKPLQKLYEEADTALYKAKFFGKNQYAFSDEPCRKSDSPCEESDAPGALRMRAILDRMAGETLVLEIRDDDIQPLYAANPFLAGGGDQRNSCKKAPSLFSGVAPETQTALRKQILRAARDNAHLDWAYSATCEDGCARWLHLRGECMPERSGKVRRMVCVRSDITGPMTQSALSETDSRQGMFDDARWAAIGRLAAGECLYMGILDASTGCVVSPSGESLDSALRRVVRSADIAKAARELAPDAILREMRSGDAFSRTYAAESDRISCDSLAFTCRWMDGNHSFALIWCRKGE